MGLLFCSSSLKSIEVVWPTSMDRRTIHTFDDFIQPAASDKIASGCFGMVRDNGHRFHEGFDIRPSVVNNNGEPADFIFSAMAGQVAYINQALNGPYGRYIILVHPQAEVPVYTLYAHLASIDSSLRVGDAIPRGKPIAIMGHTSMSSSPIAKDRAHLHFEVGLRLSDSFNQWYKENFSRDEAPNSHGVWNGQNLTGFDPYYLLSSTSVNVADVIRALPTALAVTVRTNLAEYAEQPKNELDDELQDDEDTFKLVTIPERTITVKRSYSAFREVLQKKGPCCFVSLSR